jgi:hypothetical protein
MKILTGAVAAALLLAPAAGLAASADNIPYPTGTQGIVARLESRIDEARTQWGFIKVRQAWIQGKVNEIKMRRDDAGRRIGRAADAQAIKAMDDFDKVAAETRSLTIDYHGGEAMSFLEDQDREVKRLERASQGDAQPEAFEPVEENLAALESRRQEIDQHISNLYVDASNAAAELDHALDRLIPPQTEVNAGLDPTR